MKDLRKKQHRGSAGRKLRQQADMALRLASETYWGEMALPANRRNEELIEECLNTMKQASSILHSEIRRVSVNLFSCSGSLRRAIITVCSLLLVFALSTGIAYAVGVDVWDIFFNNSNGYFQFIGTPKNADNIPSDRLAITPTDGFVEFGSVKEACEAFPIAPCLISTQELALEEKSVSAAADDAAVTLLVDYEGGERYIHYMTIMYPDPNTAFSVTLSNSNNMCEAREFDGICYYVMYSDYETVIFWCDGLYAYQVNTNVDFDALMGALSFNACEGT